MTQSVRYSGGQAKDSIWAESIDSKLPPFRLLSVDKDTSSDVLKLLLPLFVALSVSHSPAHVRQDFRSVHSYYSVTMYLEIIQTTKSAAFYYLDHLMPVSPEKEFSLFLWNVMKNVSPG